MYMYMYVYIYICVYVCVCIYMCMCILLYIYIYTYIHLFIPVNRPPIRQGCACWLAASLGRHRAGSRLSGQQKTPPGYG